MPRITVRPDHEHPEALTVAGHDRIRHHPNGLVVTSPDGTDYVITVDNAGNLGTTPA